ncbi:hypothetical protein [Streptomyces sp. NPDC059786]|uniref:hypothetical protein n=1 Tax=Streptomyces sp. NPDC059786 TaxID=3346946 RepID=UPI0036506F1D
MRGSYTWRERAQLARLSTQALRQSGTHSEDLIDPSVTRAAERIEARAADRAQREVAALMGELNKARNGAAAAKAAMRLSRGPERAAARRAMNEHERAARRIENQLRRYR